MILKKKTEFLLSFCRFSCIRCKSLDMQLKHSWIIIVIVLLSSVFQLKGQEPEKDTVYSNNSIYRNMQLQMAQPSFHFEIPELYDGDNNFDVIPIGKYNAMLNIKQTIKYSNSFSGDSSLLFLPTHPGLSDYQNFGGTLGNLNITNKLALDYGAFISAQYGYLLSSKQIVFGGNFLLRYAITNKLQLQTWGQYVTSGNSSDPTFSMRTIFPTTKFGAGLQYNSSDKSMIKVGIEHQYDLSDKTWKQESGGKVLLKF